MSRSSLTFSLSLLSLLSFAACGSSSGGTGGGGAGTGGNSATSSSSSTTSSSSTSSSSSGSTGPITQCSEIGAMECFSNYDCASASDRCENEGTDSNQVPCCVAGARGTGKGGDPCQNENDCDTGICVTDEPSPGMNRCSKVCDTDADCPADLPTCVTLVAGANGSFCL